MRSFAWGWCFAAGAVLGACSSIPEFTRGADAPDTTLDATTADADAADALDAAHDAEGDDADGPFDAGLGDVDAPPPPLTVFITPNHYSGTELGSLGGGVITGSTELCTAAGRQATGSSSRRWVAWLSTSEVSAASRLQEAQGPWVDPASGETVFLSSPTIGGRPLRVIATPTGGLTSSEFIWTGSNGTGQTAGTCDDWTNGASSALVGFPGSDAGPADGDDWTDGRGDIQCSNPLALYCFELPPN